MEISSENLIPSVRRAVVQAGSFAPGETVVVAVSGGPDSTALLHALAALRGELEIRLVAAHLDHGFRGTESEGDAVYVRALCDQLSVSNYCEYVDVPAMCKRRHLSAQTAAREVRHAFLRRVATEVGAGWIALGHNRDDRVETVLLNILRGSGLDGLVGLAPSEPPLLRPLLEVSRAEIEAYCALHSLHPRHDSSNGKTDYRRNRLRAELLPHLTSYYNQCVGDSLLRLSDIAAADTDFLNALAWNSLKSVTHSESDAEWVLDATALAQLPLALRRRVLRAAIETVRGDLRDVDMESTERILRALASERSEVVSLPFREMTRVDVAIEMPRIHIRRLAAAAQPLPWSYLVDVPGELALPRAGLILETRRGSAPAEATEMSASGQNLLIFDLREIVLPLTVRSWKSGDRMRPQGLGGTRKLQDLFTDRKIRGEERLRFPILVDAAGKVLAVLGLQADETAIRLPKEPQRNAESGNYLFLIWKRIG